ncbi:MAG: MlaD family protein [Phycisphaerales bacterium]
MDDAMRDVAGNVMRDAALPTEMSSELPTAMVRSQRVRRGTWIWLMPILAAAVMGWLMFSQVMGQRGAMVVVHFKQAGGIEPGTELRYRGVGVGVVRSVELDDDLDGVRVRIELEPSDEALARVGTKFWLVRARVGFGEVAGLETLLGPNYIALMPGAEGGAMRLEFEALDTPPTSEPMVDGSLRLVLISDRLGTLTPGNPVLYREVRVGTVRGAQLTNDATRVMISIDIEPKYTALIHEKTRFWRSGGVGVDFGIFSGLSVQADSLEAAMSSSVSLATPEKKMGEPAGAGDVFELADEVDGDWLKWSPGIGIGG